jgi:hypothetical protein
MDHEDLSELVRQLQTNGEHVEHLENWPSLGLAALLLCTESRAAYIVEPRRGKPSLVSRLSEAPPSYDEFRLPSSEAMIRRQGNPDFSLQIGKSVNILGLARHSTEFDPDSLYTTTPLVEIKYIVN